MGVRVGEGVGVGDGFDEGLGIAEGNGYGSLTTETGVVLKRIVLESGYSLKSAVSDMFVL